MREINGMQALYFPRINPVALQLGAFSIHWYGLMYAFGLFLANLLGRYRARQSHNGWTEQQVTDLAVYTMLAAILGGRLGYVLFYDLSYFMQYPSAVLAIWEGGMSFHGGLLGVLVGLKLYRYRIQKDWIALTDFIAPLVPLCLALGRIGNFINGELWGRVSKVPWAVIFPHAGPYPRHPSQLYECFLEGLCLFLILWIYSQVAKPKGAVSGMFAALYAIFRFGVEFFREPDAQLGFIAWGWLTMGQLLSLPLLGIGIILLYRAHRPQATKSV